MFCPNPHNLRTDQALLRDTIISRLREACGWSLEDIGIFLTALMIAGPLREGAPRWEVNHYQHLMTYAPLLELDIEAFKKTPTLSTEQN